MAANETCSACGCDIIAGRTEAGAAVVFAQKSYCGECAALILPPEEIARLARAGQKENKQAAPAGLLSGDDELFGEGEPTKKQVVTSARPPVPLVPSAKTAPGRQSLDPVAVAASPKSSGTKSPAAAPSRRTSVVSGVKGRRATGVTGVKAERDTGRDAAKSRQKKSDSTGLYIGLGVGALALALGGYFLLGHNSPKKSAAKKAAEFVDNDKTPSSEYARRAEELLAKHDRTGAVAMYGKAADKAQKEGNTDQAKSYNITSMNLVKSSKLNE